MARQYRIEASYLGFPTPAEIYWHDNDTIEFVTLPQVIGSESLANRAQLIAVIVALMKKDKLTNLEFTKLP